MPGAPTNGTNLPSSITSDANANLIAIPLLLMLPLLSKEPHKKKKNKVKVKRPEKPAEGAHQPRIARSMQGKRCAEHWQVHDDLG
jgi:hypothetical protein